MVIREILKQFTFEHYLYLKDSIIWKLIKKTHHSVKVKKIGRESEWMTERDRMSEWVSDKEKVRERLGHCSGKYALAKEL